MDNLEVMAPAEPEITEAEEVETEEVEASEPDHEEGEVERSEDDSEDEAAAEPEDVEVEFDGKTYRVNPALKDALMRQADYTRKTQDVAEQRKQLEAEREAETTRKTAEKEIGDSLVTLRMMENELKQFRELDWQALHHNDPALSQQMQIRYMSLKDDRDDLNNTIASKHHELQSRMERESADRTEKVKREIAATIPDYTEEQGKKWRDFAKDQIGFGEHEINNSWNNDPRIAQILKYAYLGHQITTQRQAPKKRAPSESKPAPVTQLRGKATPSKGPSDKQSIDQWMRERAKEVNAQRKRG